MMIEIQHSNSSLETINQDLLRFAIDTTLNILGEHEFDITLRLTDDAEIHQLNQSYRGVSRPTDVLSFNQNFIDPETNRLYLGDIIISTERVSHQAKQHNHSLDEECAFLAIHGTLHLLGYDHQNEIEQIKMWTLQDTIFDTISKSYKEKSK